MYFLETVEGTKGEEFTSAILKYLFINSDEFRRLFLDRIQQHFAASSLPSFKNGVICHTEVATMSGDGFVDLVLTGDNVVLGIENKIWAEVQPDQPKKYLPTLQKLAEDRCGNGDAFKVVMLAPAQREKEIAKELLDQVVSPSVSILLDWQTVMKDLNTLAQDETGEVRCVAKAFHEYLAQRINDVKINATKAKLLVGDVNPPNAFQVDFLYKVCGVFKDIGRIVGGGRTRSKWYGFSFGLAGKRVDYWARPWFGFCTEGADVDLVVQTHLEEFIPPTDSFTASHYTKDGDVWLKVRFDEKDDSVPTWREKLQPLFDELRKKFEDAPKDSV